MLAQRDHSRAELEHKLLRQLKAAVQKEARKAAQAGRAEVPDPHADDPTSTLWKTQVGLVLDDLQRDGWLSDRRAAEALVRARSARLGSRRIAQAMQSRRFEPEDIQQALGELRATEFERACAVWRQRFGRVPTDLRERARQHRFLAARGFDGDVIGRVLRQAGTPDATDDDSDGDAG